ncbi:hypothetical protein [Bathymodiolus platifrons methanotrophic gill symbiont]|uniref:hypothetical protein n=1 Tax=Bathymodiolus platifrons methanotrophic gill symbiont TaxID=113268 RepID=UPI00142D61AD|nr:hypothetical protein [Bathymodiolus platifrons methanotrophic gill symbiont]
MKSGSCGLAPILSVVFVLFAETEVQLVKTNGKDAMNRTSNISLYFFIIKYGNIMQIHG